MLTATLFALAAAVLHAGWNLAMKAQGDRFVTAWRMFVAGGILAALALPFAGLPGREAVPYLAASGTIHVFYVYFLSRAYDAGDFGLTYPMARGGGALLAAIGGVALLGDEVGLAAAAAMAVVFAGLLSLARPGASTAARNAALMTALLIGAYTLVDSRGARASDAFSYGLCLFVVIAFTVSLGGLLLGRGHAFSAGLRATWRRDLVAGAASVTAYALVLVAVTQAPVGYVTALRESSVVLGALGGWLLLKERMAIARLASSATIALGLALLVWAR
ncbi:MAG: EamA family transporter [Dehalococcoidia bacterium]